MDYSTTEIFRKVLIGILALCILFALIDLVSTVAPLSKELNDYRKIHDRAGSGSSYFSYGYDRYYESELEYLNEQIGHAWLLFFCHSAACAGICLLLGFLVDKSSDGVLGYVNDMIGYAATVHRVLVFSIALALLLAMFAMCVDSIGFIIFSSAITGLALVLMAQLYIGCWFTKAAILKGCFDPVYFWFPFLLPTIGYLLVIATPSVSQTETK